MIRRNPPAGGHTDGESLVPVIEFWFSIGSTYTYLTVMRLDIIEKNSGVTFEWKPFSVRALMQEMNNVPFKGKPVKEKYMWRDLERRARRHGIPINLPIEYPLPQFDLANRVAIVAATQGWCRDYVKAAYKLWMLEGSPAGSESNIERSVTAAGQRPNDVVEAANSKAVGTAYADATDAARSLGIFGSPSFVVAGRELFWGDDRLEDAVDWARDAS